MAYNDPLGNYKNKYALMTAYRGMCGMCLIRPATGVHEIQPRSAGAGWDTPANQIPLCATCHEKVQADTDKYTPQLYQAQRRAQQVLNTKIVVGGEHE